MQDAASLLALADRLDRQCGLLRTELERTRELGRRLSHGPSTSQWTGFARTAFDAELELLRREVGGLEQALSDAVDRSMRARETLLGNV